MIAQRALRASPGISAVVRGYRERSGWSDGPGVVVPLPGRPAQFLEIYLDTPFRVSIDGGAFAAASNAVVVGVFRRGPDGLMLVHGANIQIDPVAAAFDPTKGPPPG